MLILNYEVGKYPMDIQEKEKANAPIWGRNTLKYFRVRGHDVCNLHEEI